jgi:Major capsid protein 13-like
MAFTTTLVIPELLNALVAAQIPNTLELYRRGAASLELPDQIVGHFYQFRRWNPLAGNSEVNDGTDSGSTTKLSQLQEIGVVINRKKVVELTDAEAVIALNMGAEEATRLFAEKFAAFWPKEFERLAVLMLGALFDASAGALKDTHCEANTAKMDRTKALAMKHLLGDNAQALSAMFVHSKVGYDIEAEGLVEYLDRISGITAEGRVPTYLGMGLWQDDAMPYTGSGATTLYQSYGIAPGGLQIAMAKAARVYEQVNAKGPSVIVTQTADLVIHVAGMKYVGTTLPPTDAELATAANYQKAATDDKNIRVVCAKNYSSLDA